MPVVTNTVVDPAGHVLRGVDVVIRLMASTDGSAPGYVPADDEVIREVWKTKTGADGTWTATLTANSLIEPDNTYYEVEEGRKSEAHLIVVPNTAGPHWVGDILVNPPPALGPLLAELLEIEEAERIAADAAETAARLAADIAETAARTAADSALQADIDAEILDRANADAALADDLTAETNARVAADTAESSARSSADTTLQANITAEAAARALADTNEANARLAGDAAEASARATAITDEANARILADDALQEAIDDEEAARIAAITGEAATRANADELLQDDIEAEEATRAAADVAEAAARAAADAALEASKEPNLTAGAGLTKTTGVLNVGEGPGLQVNADSVQIGDGEVTGGGATGVGGMLAPATVHRNNVVSETLTDAEVADANKDGLANVPSLRTLGTGEFQAVAGNDIRLVRRGIRAVAIGDSTTIGGSISLATGDRFRSNNDWFAWSSLLSDGQIQYLKNAAVTGENSTQMAARFTTDVLTMSPDVVFILAGTNDAGSSVSLSTYSANIKTMVSLARLAGALPVLCTVLPRNGTTGIPQRMIEIYNAFLASYAAAQGLPLVDFYRLLTDVDGHWLAGMDSGDGIHPSEAGAKAMGQLAIDSLVSILPPWSPPLTVRGGTDSMNLVANGLFIGDANSDGVADSWTFDQPVGTPSIVSDSTIPGNWQRLTVDPSSAQGSISQAISGMTVGNRYSIGFRVAWDIEADGGYAAAMLVFTGGNPNSHIPLNSFNAGPVDNSVLYGEFTLPVGTSATNLHIFRPEGTGGAGWAQWAQMTILDLTALGVVAAL